MRKNHIILVIAVIIGSILACNLPSNTPNQQNPNAILTAAALTVEAQLSANNTPTLSPADTATGAPPTSTPTFTAAPPTATSLPAATATSSCDSALFVTDVTYPDNTVVPAGSAFTKTWRLQNTGSCSWTPSYALVFVSGNVMNGPTVQALSGNVNAGQTVDISVNLQAPSSNGTYTGNWGLRNASGVIFTHFYVQIKVTSGGGATATATTASSSTHTVAITNNGGQGGSVRSDGTVLANVPNVGDTETNITSEAFFSFNISSIPSGSTINSVIANFSNYDMLGNPFGLSDGCARAYAQSYGSLNAGDFYTGDPLGAIARWCSTSDLNNVINQPDMLPALQASVGSSRFQLRVQFRVPTTNGNGVADMIRFGAVSLKINYTTP